MRIALIAKPGQELTGIGRYSTQLRAALESLGHEVVMVYPTIPLPGAIVRAVRRLLGWDLQAFFNSYPLWARYPQADIYHLTSQNLATLMVLHRPPGHTVITVHDIIPWMLRDNVELRVYGHRLEAWFDRLALSGLARADALLADSADTTMAMHELRDQKTNQQ